MKKMSLFILLALLTSSCANDSDSSLDTHICYEGTVIGKIRSWGGGVAVSMKSSALSTREWKGFQHVVEVHNIPGELCVAGHKIYFSARPATAEEVNGPRSADGVSSFKPEISAITISTTECPEGTKR